MTFNQLWELTNEAASKTAEFETLHDYADQVGPDTVLKLLLIIERYANAVDFALSKHQLGSRSTLAILEARRYHDEAFDREEIDEPPFSL